MHQITATLALPDEDSPFACAFEDYVVLWGKHADTDFAAQADASVAWEHILILLIAPIICADTSNTQSRARQNTVKYFKSGPAHASGTFCEVSQTFNANPDTYTRSISTICVDQTLNIGVGVPEIAGVCLHALGFVTRIGIVAWYTLLLVKVWTYRDRQRRLGRSYSDSRQQTIRFSIFLSVCIIHPRSKRLLLRLPLDLEAGVPIIFVIINISNIVATLLSVSHRTKYMVQSLVSLGSLTIRSSALETAFLWVSAVIQNSDGALGRGETLLDDAVIHA
ncbi:uncharacterized protein EV420DRAFT_1751051 [Desarmillaria tabescens]|uniref:Uncharacterized protein n=1 Tax=Armillaria tabescens TaxID=1929756 RepID=A0AA39JSR4_ARMTA|nr:uncharacterized protein EV420DRAFT_1751051 [Desarmillaria tabescens]KAK0447837.1 hypothetical protein EV420DRAFT_1751051 [Desarmillaria tabescens]